MTTLAMTDDARTAGEFALDDLKWERRILVIAAPSPDVDGVQEQQQSIAQTADDFSERDLVLLQLFEDSASSVDRNEIDDATARRIRERLGITAGAFQVLLIGKDGTVKLRDDEPVPMRQVYALIDTMPMRRREMREPIR